MTMNKTMNEFNEQWHYFYKFVKRIIEFERATDAMKIGSVSIITNQRT